MKTHERLVVGVIFLFNVGTSVADECDSILEQGVRNTYQELKQRDLRTGFRDAMCQTSSAGGSSSSESGLNVTVPIYGVPVTFGGNYNQAKSDTTSSGACRGTSSSLNDASYSSVLQQVVAPEIVAAWSECRTKQGGFFINGEINGNLLILEFRFRPIGNVTSTRLMGAPDITGADCPNAVARNETIITNTRLLQKCYRVGNGEVTVIANSEFDGARFFIPAVQKAPLPPVVQPAPASAIDCKSWTGPGIPIECLGKRNLPGVGVAPEGYTWCILDAKFNSPPNIQGHCFSREDAGACHCAKVPPGFPQPSMKQYGTVYTGQ